ncbi:MAG: peptidase M23 [Bacteroidetes bacterium QH_10_64_19]|nr:MAG: peptidase M23 [Bacteroidetes bacterium QH_10_64_19]
MVCNSARARLRILLWALVAPLVLPPTAYGQDVEAQRRSTQKRLKQLQQQIDQEKATLQKTRKAEEATQKKLKSLQREIALREELVSTYQTRLRQLGQERSALRDTLNTLQGRLAALRDEYRQRLVHAYKYGRLHELALLLASRSINQMLVRARYLRQFAADRREQRSAIQTAADEVRRSREQLAEKRAETRDLLAEARTERENLRALERDRRAVINELRARRSELEEEIEEKQEQAQQLERRIRKLVARADREAEDASAENSPPSISKSLAASFQQNRGALPWPAEGAVTVGFGDQVDPVHGTTTYHPGILIATRPEAPVQAIFDGVVSGIDFVPGYGTYVVVRHGEYLSVYSNFSSLSISENQRISAGQVLGQSGTENEPRGASVFFGVVNRSTSEFVDPSQWLSTR